MSANFGHPFIRACFFTWPCGRELKTGVDWRHWINSENCQMPMEPDIPTTTVTGVKKKGWSIGEKTGVWLTVLAALALICEIANMGWSIGGQTGWYLTLIAALALICGKKGWSKGEKTGVCLAVIAALALICGGWSTGVKTGVCLTVIVALIALIFSSSHLKNASYSCLLKCFRILEKRRKSDLRSAAAESPQSPNPPSEVPLIDQPKMSDQTFYDIYLVYTSKQTPQVDKIKKMCRQNGWKFTTPFGGKLGVPLMQSVQEAVKTCSHVVLVITEDDCLKKNLEYSMTTEMAFEMVALGELSSKVITIRCCDTAFLPPMLRCLQGSHIDDYNLERIMKMTIDKEIRMKREGQCQSVSGAPGQV